MKQTPDCKTLPGTILQPKPDLTAPGLFRYRLRILACKGKEKNIKIKNPFGSWLGEAKSRIPTLDMKYKTGTGHGEQLDMPWHDPTVELIQSNVGCIPFLDDKTPGRHPRFPQSFLYS